MNAAGKALVAMSGGVDSSVAALLSVKAGYECVGCTMKLFEGADTECGEKACCTAADADDARRIAYRLGMKYYVFNFTDDFRDTVIRDFAAGYLAGRTPNPCIECNRLMKFDKLWRRAALLGCDKFVTGHYARIAYDGNAYRLKTASDKGKDQSYVLYFMTQDQLAHTLFPLGELSKTEVRAIAAENGFVNAAKPDSQDICFVPDGDHAAAIENFTGEKSPCGDFVDLSGKPVGRHNGIIRYTVGQRRGLGISSSSRLYVCGVDPDANTVTLGRENDLFFSSLIADDFNWISGKTPEKPFSCGVRIRYRHPSGPAV